MSQKVKKCDYTTADFPLVQIWALKFTCDIIITIVTTQKKVE